MDDNYIEPDNSQFYCGTGSNVSWTPQNNKAPHKEETLCLLAEVHIFAGYHDIKSDNHKVKEGLQYE